MKRADWSRRLPQTLIIPGVMTLATMADVRKLMQYLPAGHRELYTCRHVAADWTRQPPAPKWSTSLWRCAWCS